MLYFLRAMQAAVVSAIVGFSVFIVYTVWYGHLSVVMLPRPSTPMVHTPMFSANQCFTKVGLHEPWDKDVAGTIVRRGYMKYLVLYASEAERRGMDKTGWEEPIIEFDTKYKPTPCPKEWLEHGHTK